MFRKARVLSAIICIALIATSCRPGIFKKGAEYNVSTDALTVQTEDNVSIIFSEFDIEGDTEITVSEVNISIDIEGLDASDVTVTSYDFIAPSVSEFSSLIDIIIPYDESIIEDGQSVSDCVSAGYYNEITEELEPVIFEIDEVNKNVIITTDHLSTYSVFTFKNSNKRTATVELLPYYDMEEIIDMSLYDSTGLVNEIANGSIPGEMCYAVGFDVAMASLNIVGSSVTFLSEAVTTSESLSGLNSLLGKVGKAAAFAQFAVDIAKGDSQQLYMNTIKNYSSLIVGTLAPLAAVGVFAIDYSLNEFGSHITSIKEEALQAGYDKWYQEYESKQNHHLSVRAYGQVIEKYYQYQRGGIEDLNSAIDDLVKVYTTKIWADPNYEEAFGNDLSGLNSTVQQELSDAAYNKVMKQIMQNVFSVASRKIQYNEKMKFVGALKEVKAYLNQKITFNIVEILPEENSAYIYADHIVRFGALSERADATTWVGKLNEKGSGKATATLLGYLQAGSPSYIEVFVNGDAFNSNEAVLNMPFTMNIPETTIELTQNNNPFVGTWTFYLVGKAEYDYQVTLVFQPDMTGKVAEFLTVLSKTEPGNDDFTPFTYSYDDEIVTINISSKDIINVFPYKINGSLMILEVYNGDIHEFVKEE